eukprot:1632975-Rhodomonas_salina.1
MAACLFSPRRRRGASLLATLVLSNYCAVAGAASSPRTPRGVAFALSRPAPSFLDSSDLARRTSTLSTASRALLEARTRARWQGPSVLRMSGAGSSSELHQGMKDLADK